MMAIDKKTIINMPSVFYTASFLQNISYGIIGPLFVVYCLSINFNPAQIGILFAAERISTLFFEIPTGGFADKYGRKKSLLLSFLMVSLIFLVWFFSQKFYILLIAAILWGLSYTFQSGAEESLIIESLKLAKDDNKRNKVFSRISMSGNFGFFIGGLIGALLAFYFLRSIWLIASLISILVFALYLIFTKEKDFQPKFSKIEGFLDSLLGLIKKNLLFALKNKIILAFLIITFLYGFSYAFYTLGYPVLLKKVLEIPTYYFSLLGSLSALMGILGAYYGEKSAQKFGFIPSLTSFSIIASLSLILFGLIKTFVLALILFALIALIESARYPIYQSFLNKFIPSEKRATLLSINSVVGTSALALGELTAGFLLVILYSGYVLIIGGLLLFFVLPFLYQIKKKASLD